jgi:hypothetical protein
MKRSANLGRAFSEILAFSSLAARASSLWVSSPSLARSSLTTAADDTAVGPEDDGGDGMHRAYEDKLIAHQLTFQPTTMDGQNLTSSKRV